MIYYSFIIKAQQCRILGSDWSEDVEQITGLFLMCLFNVVVSVVLTGSFMVNTPYIQL